MTFVVKQYKIIVNQQAKQTKKRREPLELKGSEKMGERYKDTAEYRDVLKILPDRVKAEILSNAAIFEMAYKSGIAEGIRRSKPATAVV